MWGTRWWGRCEIEDSANIVSFIGSKFSTSAHASTRQTLGNVGAQTDVRFQLLTLQPLTLSAGYARAFHRRRFLSDEWMVSLKLL